MKAEPEAVTGHRLQLSSDDAIQEILKKWSERNLIPDCCIATPYMHISNLSHINTHSTAHPPLNLTIHRSSLIVLVP